MCELLVGLPEVDVLGVGQSVDGIVRVEIQVRAPVAGCPDCGVFAHVKDRSVVELVDLPAFGRPSRLLWRKRRLTCPELLCPVGSWTESDTRIAYPRLVMTDRAGRWATEQVGRYARSVNEVALELGCDWHTVNEVVIAYGTALVDDDPDRYGTVNALGLDETLFAKLGPRHRQHFSTSIVDVQRGQLLDIVAGRKAAPSCQWLQAKGKAWRDHVKWATFDMSGSYRAVFNTMLPDAIQIASPFHVQKHANHKLDECRRRVQNETMGHRGRKTDPLYRCRRLLTKANERLDSDGRSKLMGLLRAGDPNGEVATAWQAKEAVSALYIHTDPDLALEWVQRLADDFVGNENPVEVRSLGRTLRRWKHQIAAWHQAHVSNGPTEAINNLIKRVKRGAFGFTRFRNYRIRSLLYAGKPNWELLETITPR